MLQSAAFRTPENTSRPSERLISSTPLNTSSSHTKKVVNARRRIVPAMTNRSTSSDDSTDDESDEEDDDDDEEEDDDDSDDDSDLEDDNRTDVEEHNTEAAFSDSSPILIGKQNFSSKIHSVAPRNASLAISSRIADSMQSLPHLQPQPQQQSQPHQSQPLQPNLGKNVRMSKEKQKFFRHSAFNSERTQKSSSPGSANLASSANRTGKKSDQISLSVYNIHGMELSKKGFVSMWLAIVRTKLTTMTPLSLVLYEPRFSHQTTGILGNSMTE